MRTQPEKLYTLIELKIVQDVLEIYRTRLFYLLKEELDASFIIIDIRVKDLEVTVGFKYWTKDIDDHKFGYVTFTEEDLNESSR